METADVTIQKDTFQKLVKQLDEIKDYYKQFEATSAKTIYDNSEFVKLMKVSTRTAQTWRDQGLISFTQVGNKIYYQKEDIEVFLIRHKIPSTSKT